MAKSSTLQEGGTEGLPVVQGDATRRTTLAGFLSVAVPLMPERLKANPGSSSLGFLQSGAGAAARTVQDRLRETVSLKDFGAVGNGVADETAAFFKARDHCATTGARLVIPNGDYKYTESPNWAITDLEVVAQGRVRLYYTGAGDGLLFDAGPDADDMCSNVRFCVGNRIHLYGKAMTKNGVWGRSVHHSYIGVDVHGCGRTYSGLYTQFAVCTVWDVVVSGNENGWFEGNKPGSGYKLDKRLASETTSYCYFPNPIVEGVGVGIHLVATLGNLFLGGTSEGCSEYGVVADVGAMWDRFIGTNFEVNKIADIYCNGIGIEFISCDTYNYITLGSLARRCVINGGGHEHILVDTGSIGCSVVNAVFNRRETGGTLIDNGAGTEVSNARNGAPPYTQYLTGSLTLASVTVGYAGTSVETISVPGAKLGDFFIASCDAGMGGFQMSCHCNAPGIVNVMFTNFTDAAAHRVACTVKVRGTRGA